LTAGHGQGSAGGEVFVRWFSVATAATLLACGGKSVGTECPAHQPHAGSLSLSTQGEEDALPLITDLEGDLTVSGSVSNLRRLGCLRTVDGGVTIKSTTALANLAGLDQLEQVQGSLTLSENDALTSLDALHDLSRIGGDLTIADHPLLADIDGIEGLARAGEVYLARNDRLENLEGLSGLVAAGWLKLVANPLLGDLEGLRNLRTLAPGILLREAPSVTSLAGLRNLTTARMVYLYDTGIFSLEGLGPVEPGAGLGLTVDQNASLRSLAGLDPALKELRMLQIDGNPVLEDCRGLEALETVGDLSIQHNSALSGLEGLEALTTVHDSITIAENPVLPSCQAERLAQRVDTPNVYVFENDANAACP
jgi:hypothetical protein